MKVFLQFFLAAVALYTKHHFIEFVSARLMKAFANPVGLRVLHFCPCMFDVVESEEHLTSGGGFLTITVNGILIESVTIADDINGLAVLTISNAPQVDLQNFSVTTGNIAVTGSNIDLNGTTYISAGGSVTFSGAVDLDSPTGASVTSGGEAGDDISFAGAIDGKDDNTQSLTLDAGSAGTVSVSGALGGTASKQIKTLTITNSSGATLPTVQIEEPNEIQTKVFNALGYTIKDGSVLQLHS